VICSLSESEGELIDVKTCGYHNDEDSSHGLLGCELV